MIAFDYGTALAEKMKSELPDDYVGSKIMETYGALAQMVFDAGKGDYLEIGAWRGASAVIAAKTKEEYGIGGRIVCVDHFRGYINLDGDMIRAQAEETMQRYGVDDIIDIYQQPSRPFPEVLKARRFMCALIDGDHWNENPWQDFLEIQGLVDKFIMFDDDDVGHPGVQAAVDNAATHPGWRLRYKGETCSIVERITDGE